MAVTVVDAYTKRRFEWHTDKDGTHALIWTNVLYLALRRGKKAADVAVTFYGRDDNLDRLGFKCDGLSVPKMFRWFLKDWDPENELYNLAGALHDWLYATEGVNGLFSRSECDDIFRGLLRESGMNRFHASTADLMVGLFAGNKRHWGNDEYGIVPMARLEAA